MQIDQKVKDAVRAKLLSDLDDYLRDAEEHEDEETLKDDAGKRLSDFYLYRHHYGRS